MKLTITIDLEHLGQKPDPREIGRILHELGEEIRDDLDLSGSLFMRSWGVFRPVNGARVGMASLTPI